MAEYFPRLGRYLNTQIHGAQRIPSKGDFEEYSRIHNNHFQKLKTILEPSHMSEAPKGYQTSQKLPMQSLLSTGLCCLQNEP